MTNKKLYSFRLPEDLMEEIRAKADAERVSATDLVIKFIRQGLNQGMDKRLETLEGAVKSLQESSSMSPTSLYTLVPQDSMLRQKSQIEDLCRKVEKLTEKLSE